MVLLLVGCTINQPEIMPAETADVVDIVWEYIALGDMRTASADWPYLYANHIEEDLGVRVTVLNKASISQTSVTLLELVRNLEPLREAIRKAEVVTVWTGGHMVEETLIRHYQPCHSEGVDAFGRDLDSIIFEILALRRGKPTIIRLLEFYQFRVAVLRELNLLDEKKACLIAYNEQIHQVASKYRIPVAPVHQAFNGINGNEDSEEKGYQSTVYAFSREGDECIADLLSQLGYDPITHLGKWVWAAPDPNEVVTLD